MAAETVDRANPNITLAVLASLDKLHGASTDLVQWSPAPAVARRPDAAQA